MSVKAAVLLIAFALALFGYFLLGSDKPAQVRVDDVQIAYGSMGEGKPVILIMGLGGTMDMWDSGLLETLSKNRRVITFDNRGMGYSTSSNKRFSIELFANDTADLMDSLGIEKADVVGWSLGTYIAQELALRHPEKVDKLVLYAADCGGNLAVMPPDETIAELSHASGTEKEKNERLLSLLFPPEWLSENPDPSKYIPEIKETSSPGSIARQADAWHEWPGACDRLYRVPQPTLLITGSEDVLTPPINSVIMLGYLPNSDFEIISGGGHGLMYQDLGFKERVEEFLGN